MADNTTLSPTFSFGEQQVRAVVRDGGPWFAASDVCAALGYANPSKAVADHLDDDERYNQPLERGGSLLLINESGLYALVLRSRKPKARAFAKWVTAEVLPAIRKTGSYVAQPETISPAQQQTLKAMINVASSATQTSHQELWSRFHDHFKVARYDQLPAARYDDAVEYLRDGVTQDSDAMSRLAAAAFLRGRQFLLTVDHRGNASMRKLECWEAVVACDEVPTLISSGWVPRQTVADVAAAAVRRLSQPVSYL